MKWGMLCLFLLLMTPPAGEPQTLHITVVEGTLHVTYMLITEESHCNHGDALDVTAHISWHTEKEKTTSLTLLMKGTPYTQGTLAERVKTPLILELGDRISTYEGEDVEGFWETWFDEISRYGVFSDYSKKILFNWNETEIHLHEDEKGTIYTLEATYYDFFTKFYPTPEAFFDEREIDFQLIFGIHSIAPTTELSVTVDLPEGAELALADPSFSTADEGTLILTVSPGTELSNIRLKFTVGRYQGTELPRLEVVKESSSSHLEVGEQGSITVTARNVGSAEACKVRIEDAVPEGIEIVEGEPTLGIETLHAEEEVVLTYMVKAHSQGDFGLKGAHVEFEDQFGKKYTVDSNSITITVAKKSAGSVWIIVLSMITFYVVKKQKR
ncbi:MAG: BatD family protein [Candidatus Methanofastidiosia archaeon]